MAADACMLKRIHRAEDGYASGDATQLISKITVGTKLAVYWQDDDAYYPGVVAAHRPYDSDDRLGHDVYTIEYDDGEVEMLELATERFRIIGEAEKSVTADDEPSLDRPPTSLVGNRKPTPTPMAFLYLDGDYEIYWCLDGVGEWSSYIPHQEKITFYEYSFSTKTCEVEWDKDGTIHHTRFRQTPPTRKRKKVDRTITTFTDTPKKRPRAPRRKSSKSKKLSWRTTESTSTNTTVTTPGLGPFPSKPHFITEQLDTTREDLISTLPIEMRTLLGHCCWSPWKGAYRPALILSPFEVEGGNGGIAEKWLSAYMTYHSKDISQLPYLLYWYEEGWRQCKNFKAFSLVKKELIFSYETGIAQGWHTPFSEKMMDPHRYGMLTEEEDDILRGIQQMHEDQQLPNDCRGGPMFFPHLREEEKEIHKENLLELRKKYDSWATRSHGYKECIRQGTSDVSGTTIAQMSSLELCAGEEVMSQALGTVGFETATLDNDLKRSATSQLSLEELEGRIINGEICDHPHLNKSFSAVWAAPEYRTWSIASNGRYRNKCFIDGFRNRALEKDAQQARRDIESLINILSYYRQRNPELIMVIENPAGYLHHHPVSRLFHDILGLQRVKISYCQFSTKTNLYPQKDTHLWTNSPILIHQFDDKKFVCQQKGCKGLDADGKHIAQVQDLSDKCSAYPFPMCRFIAGVLVAEAVKGTLGRG
mmetsp:Transcript_16905/g.36475  ORF Transcript_16905/g.36475 Transcript_16905/m.36475 type:complete len:705 (+) Transcript_16905:176-2290(+)